MDKEQQIRQTVLMAEDREKMLGDVFEDMREKRHAYASTEADKIINALLYIISDLHAQLKNACEIIDNH